MIQKSICQYRPRSSYDLTSLIKEGGELSAPHAPSFKECVQVLDGCATAMGKDWRRAFGIFPLDAPNQAGRNKTGPQAYVGWATIHDSWMNSPDPNGVYTAQAYTATLNNFYSMWMKGATLKDCIDTASVSSFGTAPLLVPKNKNVTVRGNGHDPWSYTNLDTSKIYIVGFPGLKVDRKSGAEG